jgi:hypothetical protein
VVTLLYIVCEWQCGDTTIYGMEHKDFNLIGLLSINGARGGAVVEALRYKQEVRGINSRWCHRNLSLTQSFQPNYGPGVDSASNRNEYEGYFLGVKTAGA